ncbi:hypothetical protein AAG570_003401 [Ranatra chinensis]|uniref:Uncharacterized protein n=1 Tax=Ranatra chinensis TaxID=642074 RepID=A0ABD0YLL0_9HEMI
MMAISRNRFGSMNSVLQSSRERKDERNREGKGIKRKEREDKEKTFKEKQPENRTREFKNRYTSGGGKSYQDDRPKLAMKKATSSVESFANNNEEGGVNDKKRTYENRRMEKTSRNERVFVKGGIGRGDNRKNEDTAGFRRRTREKKVDPAAQERPKRTKIYKNSQESYKKEEAASSEVRPKKVKDPEEVEETLPKQEVSEVTPKRRNSLGSNPTVSGDPVKRRNSEGSSSRGDLEGLAEGLKPAVQETTKDREPVNKTGGEVSRQDSAEECGGGGDPTQKPTGSAKKTADNHGTKLGKDPRTERRIRNKDRPSIEIYRPGMGKFSKQRLEKEKALGSSTEVDSPSHSPSPTPKPPPKLAH